MKVLSTAETHSEAPAVQIREPQQVQRLSGKRQGKRQGWHAEGSIVKKNASGCQALCGWTPFDHDQIKRCQEVVQTDRDIAIEIEGEVCGSSHQSPCSKDNILSSNFVLMEALQRDVHAQVG